MAANQRLAEAIAAAIAASLRQSRKRQGLTQLEVSRRTGGVISKAALANYESGNRSLRVEIFWAIAKALGEHPGELMAAAERAAGFAAHSDEEPVSVDAAAVMRSTDPRLAPVRRWFEMRLQSSGARLAVHTVVLDAGAVAALAELMGVDVAQCRAALAAAGSTNAGLPVAGSMTTGSMTTGSTGTGSISTVFGAPAGETLANAG